MTVAIGALFGALAAGCLAFGLAGMLRRDPIELRVRSLARSRQRASGPLPSRPALRRPASSIPRLSRALSGGAITLDLQRAGISLRPVEFLLARLLLGLLAGGAALLVVPNTPIALLLAAGLAAAGYWAPQLIVRRLARRRVARIEAQLVEFLPLLASSLRAGFALQHGIEAAARQLGGPLGAELAALMRDVGLGASVNDALRDLSERTGSRDFDMVVTAMLVQRLTGGSLAEVLDQAAETLRERERIRGDVQTFTAQQRLTGTVLAVYPLAVGGLLFALMPSVWSKLLTEPAGQVQLAIAGGLQILGFLWIRRALRVEV